MFFHWARVVFCVGLLPLSWIQAEDSPVTAPKLEAARQRYDSAWSEFSTGLLQHLDRQLELTRKSGDLTKVQELETARSQFEKSNIFPDQVPVPLYRKLRGAHLAYEAACDVAIKGFTKSGNDDQAKATSQLLEKLQQLGLQQSTRIHGTIRISAQSEIGYDVGSVSKNEILELSYIAGTWKGWGRIASDSPDSAELEKGNRNRVVICEADALGRTRVLGVVPAGTKYRPFQWKANRNFERIVLRINDDDHDFVSNPDGNVRYDLRILRGT